MLRLAWERVSVPPPIVEWLIALDEDNHSIVRTEWAVAEWERAGYEAFDSTSDDGKVPFFSPERGSGQGDTAAPLHGWCSLIECCGPWSYCPIG